MAINTSLRPRIRPDNIDKQMTESLRPKSREEGLIERRQKEEERNRQTKGFGDLEYRAELEPQLSWNPIARLGYDPDKHKIVNTQGAMNLFGTAMFINRLGGGERSVRNLMRAGLSRKDAERVKEDDVITSPNLSFSPVISHEFTHRGFNLLRKEREKDPEAFDKKYGKDAGKILEYTKHKYSGGIGESTEEYYVEMFDDLNSRFNTSSQRIDEDYEDFPKNTMRGTVQSSFAGPTKPLRDYSPEADDKRFEQIRAFQDKVLNLRGMDKGILGLMDAAQDILTEQGEPPKFKKQTKSFFEKIFNFSEGGLVDTGKKTPEGRIIWNDGGKDYSERSTTFEIDGKWYTMPTVAEDGSQYTSDQIRDYVAEYGPIDFLTGEKLPEFKSRDDALEYAVSRSDTRKGYDEGGLAEQTEDSYDSLINEYLTPVNSSDYRKRLVDMSDEEKAAVAPAADNFKNLFGDRSEKPLSVKGSEIGLEFTPAGTVFGLNDIKNELAKENPDYYLVGLMGGAEIIGLIPGLDKVAIDAIRSGAKRITGSKKVDQT